MPKAVISDASCFILLKKIDQLDLLRKIYGSVVTTPTVMSEVRFEMPDWVVVRKPANTDLEERLRMVVDRGEASAMVLALETDDSTLILDDLRARKEARSLGIEVTGTLGVILKGKRDGCISAVDPLIQAIRKTNFRLSKEVEEEVLRLAGESEV